MTAEAWLAACKTLACQHFACLLADLPSLQKRTDTRVSGSCSGLAQLGAAAAASGITERVEKTHYSKGEELSLLDCPTPDVAAERLYE